MATQSLCPGFPSLVQTYLVFPRSCPQTPPWRALLTPLGTELTNKPLLSSGGCWAQKPLAPPQGISRTLDKVSHLHLKRLHPRSQVHLVRASKELTAKTTPLPC